MTSTTGDHEAVLSIWCLPAATNLSLSLSISIQDPRPRNLTLSPTPQPLSGSISHCRLRPPLNQRKAIVDFPCVVKHDTGLLSRRKSLWWRGMGLSSSIASYSSISSDSDHLQQLQALSYIKLSFGED